MHKFFGACTFGLLGMALVACAPPGQGQLGFRDIDWPRADHQMTPSENREIEILLGQLGYLKGRADGKITTTTRSAIRVYQRDIGAPVTGYVSIPLLSSLRVNAPEIANTVTAAPQPVATPPRQPRPARLPRPAADTSAPSGGGAGGGGGGAGGAGGGAWN